MKVFLASLVLGLSVREIFATTPLERQSRCYEALRGLTKGPTLKLKSGLLFEPEAFDVRKGFYLFGKDIIYSCRFSAKPTESNPYRYYYYLKVHVDAESPEYMSILVSRDDMKLLAGGLGPGPLPGKTYRSASCRKDVTPASRTKFSEVLKTRISAVFALYTRRKADKELAGENESTAETISALNLCREVPELASISRRELAKFPSAAASELPVNSDSPPKW